eukprot:scaffold24421_cov104-Skeletonema_marinoi.AAC.1
MLLYNSYVGTSKRGLLCLHGSSSIYCLYFIHYIISCERHWSIVIFIVTLFIVTLIIRAWLFSRIDKRTLDRLFRLLLRRKPSPTPLSDSSSSSRSSVWVTSSLTAYRVGAGAMNAQQPTSISTWLGQIKLKKIMSLQEPRAKNSVVLGVIFTREVGGAGGAVLGPAPGDPGFALLVLVEAAAVIKPRAMGASAS